MPYAITSDNVRLYYEEVGQGTPILFVHEFAGDHRSWEPQLREFGKRYRCIAYAARGYTPSDVPAVGRRLQLPACDARLRRRARSSQDRQARTSSACRWAATPRCRSRSIIPARVRSMTLAGTGSGSERWYTETFHKNSRELARAVRARRLGRGGQDLRQRSEPRAVRDQGCARLRGICKASGRARRARLGPYLARLSRARGPRCTISRTPSGKLTIPALIVVGDEDDRCIEPSLFLKSTRSPPPAWSCSRRPAMW